MLSAVEEVLLPHIQVRVGMCMVCWQMGVGVGVCLPALEGLGAVEKVLLPHIQVGLVVPPKKHWCTLVARQISA